MSADLAALADEALYAEQWLLQGQPVGSLTPMASKMREIEAVLRALAAADEKMPVAAWLLEFGAISLRLGDPSRITDFEAFHTEGDAKASAADCDYDKRIDAVVRATDAQAAVLAADREWYGKLQAADAEIERLRALTHCGCGDQFTVHDPGACINCVIGMTALKGEPDAN